MVAFQTVPRCRPLNEARKDSHEVAGANEVTAMEPNPREASANYSLRFWLSTTTPNGPPLTGAGRAL
jgi:hypothetical protein